VYFPAFLTYMSPPPPPRQLNGFRRNFLIQYLQRILDNGHVGPYRPSFHGGLSET
jgi:hypothetical protein